MCDEAEDWNVRGKVEGEVRVNMLTCSTVLCRAVFLLWDFLISILCT